MKTKLKPCPFCGNEYPKIKITTVAIIHCENCGAATSFTDMKLWQAEGIEERWNRRHNGK